MRLVFSLALLAAMFSPLPVGETVWSASAAEDCTGENCSPPPNGSSGRDCESKKQEDTVS